MSDTLEPLKPKSILFKFVSFIIFSSILIVSLYYYNFYQYYNIEVTCIMIGSINPIVMDRIYFDDKWGLYGNIYARKNPDFPVVVRGGRYIHIAPKPVPTRIETSWYDPLRQSIYKVTLQDQNAPLKARQFLKKQPKGIYQYDLIVVVRDETLEMWLRGDDFRRYPHGGICLTLLSQQKATVVEGDKKEYAGLVKIGIKNDIFPADTLVPE